ncbi:2-amino-4-hydroxy-6-hydroxymethyldihydropteridine pyrophosphokinase [Fictibacillus macauensis ZFHKF-1]|uniref:2-amino-4-hydroxy-6-hydroxymethyldihydropteridine diphosphokinase n=2 Tax=Fictibacillus TaxID=1329200 RepID=I8UBJ3_9BACL|nr:2-amino-4-hydroxy-6-hydroxymethyldihydropteridine pyrophosphokinase [Fictibacillus macauensis ZFHKF-1]
MNEAYVSLGSNIGNRAAYLNDALTMISDMEQTELAAVSSLYETEPVGYTEQPSFLNMVIALHTSLTPFALLKALQEIEQTLKRTRDIRWGPRTIDLDILLYNRERILTEQLHIPHPRMLERAFVLIPLIEIAPELQVPGEEKSLAELVNQLQDKEGVHKWKSNDGEEESEPFES